MTDEAKPFTTNMKAAIGLLYIFVIAIIAALIITVLSVPLGVKVLASAAVSPLIALNIVFIYFCGKGKAWSFAGAAVLGAVGVMFRVIVSTRPSLEVGGGLPIGVTVVYIVLGAIVALKNYEAFLDLRKP